MLIEWQYNDNANSWELYVDGVFKDHIKVYYSLTDSYNFFFRGQFIWSDLEVAKKEMEGWYV